MAHDFIVWGERKYRDLARFDRRVVAVLDDEPLLLSQAQQSGLKAIRISRPYNEEPHFKSAANLVEAKNIFHAMLNRWEEENR